VQFRVFHQAQSDPRRQGFVAVAYHRSHPWQSCQLFRSALRIAARDHNSCSRIRPMRTPDKRPRRTVGFCGHAAGIHDHHVGFGGLLRAMSRGKQSAAYRFTVRARRPATKMLHVKARTFPQFRTCWPTLEPLPNKLQWRLSRSTILQEGTTIPRPIPIHANLSARQHSIPHVARPER
jgi:hypothetical protein